MALFPGDLSSTYYDEKDRDILKHMEDFYTQSISINQSFWSEADIDNRFFSGDQTLWNDIYGNLSINRRRQFSFNRIRRIVNMISGYQRRNRKSTIVVPVENGDEETADQFTKIMMWANQQDNILETVSEGFQGALVTGMNLLQVWLDFNSDPVSGNIRIDNCSYNSFLIDPYFRKADLSDCNGLWKRSFLTKRECIALLPNNEDELLSLNGHGGRDGKFEYMPESFNFGMKNLLTYDEFYYRDYRKQRVLVDSQTGETMEWNSSNEDSLKDYLRLFPQVFVIDRDIPTVKLAIIVQGKTMYNGANPLGIDKYPFIPVFGYFTPELTDFQLRIQGVVRGLRDAQFLYNRRKIIELDMLESQVTSGWKFKENALVNPKDIYKTGQGKGIALKEESQMSDVEQIQPPQIPQSMIALSEGLSSELEQISGVNEELLGSAIDDKAGILSMLRQGAGLTTLQVLFDQLDRSQKLLGKLMIDIVQNNFTPGKVKKIIEAEPTNQFYKKAFGIYDAAVEEGLNTTTQKQMQFAQLLQLREIGVPIPDDVLIDAVTIQNKKSLREAIVISGQEKEQMQQLQLQTTIEEQQARTKLAQARTVADEGLGLERMSRISENEALAVERRAEAVKDQNIGLLNYAKALKELEDIDISQIERLLTVAKMLETKRDVELQPTGLQPQAVQPSGLQQEGMSPGLQALMQRSGSQPEGSQPQVAQQQVAQPQAAQPQFNEGVQPQGLQPEGLQ